MRRLRKDERGISTIIVVVSLLGIFGATMLSLDAGNMWQTRRKIVTGTDSTSLQQAKTYAFNSVTGAGSEICPTGIADSWTDHLTSVGGSGTTPIKCEAFWNADGTGYVVVEGSKNAKTRFGQLLGIGDTQPYSLSAAQWGFITEAEGLRPMGVCAKNDHFRQWVALKDGTITQGQYDALADTGDVGKADGADADVFLDPDNATPPPGPGDGLMDYPSYPAVTGVVHRIFFQNESPDECGPDDNKVPGNWGWVDFNYGSNQNSDLVDWILYGYNESVVGIDDCDADGDETGGETGDPCDGEPGSSGGSVAGELQTLVNNQTKFAVPIYDEAALNGSNATLSMFAFVGVILRGFDVTGPQAGRYFDFEFVDLQLSGTCCVQAAPGGIDTGIRGVKICAVDHDENMSAARIAERCEL